MARSWVHVDGTFDSTAMWSDLATAYREATPTERTRLQLAAEEFCDGLPADDELVGLIATGGV